VAKQSLELEGIAALPGRGRLAALHRKMQGFARNDINGAVIARSAGDEAIPSISGRWTSSATFT
jgi:hypothetical protein